MSSAQGPVPQGRNKDGRHSSSGGQDICLKQNLPFILCSFQGFDEDLQQEGMLLGQFTYNQDGEPIQTFYFQV